MNNGTLAILLIFGTPLVAIVGFVCIKALKILKETAPGQSQHISTEETKLMQELYQGLVRMEERVEALETLLLDRERKEGSHDTTR
jgi:phage shock protein B